MLAFLWLDVFIMVCMYVCYVSNKTSVLSMYGSFHL